MTATTAQVVGSTRDHRLIIRPMASIQAARAEFGPTLGDAKGFVLDTACTECGSAAAEVVECVECEEYTCRCFDHPHRDGEPVCAGCWTGWSCRCRHCADGY